MYGNFFVVTIDIQCLLCFVVVFYCHISDTTGNCTDFDDDDDAIDDKIANFVVEMIPIRTESSQIWYYPNQHPKEEEH